MSVSAVIRFLMLLQAGHASDWKKSLQQAVALQQSGDLASASSHYRAALEAHPPLRQTSNDRPPIKHRYDQRETLRKRISDDPQQFKFRRKQKMVDTIFRSW